MPSHGQFSYYVYADSVMVGNVFLIFLYQSWELHTYVPITIPFILCTVYESMCICFIHKETSYNPVQLLG